MCLFDENRHMKRRLLHLSFFDTLKTPAPSSEDRRFSFARKEDSPLPQKKRICLPPAALVRVVRLFALGGLAKLRGGFVIVALEGAAEASVVEIAYLQDDFGDGKIGCR